MFCSVERTFFGRAGVLLNPFGRAGVLLNPSNLPGYRPVLRGNRKSSQKLAKRITLVSFSTPPPPPPPPETNGNRKTGFNVPPRKGSVDFDFLELGKKKQCTQELFSRPLKKWNITNRACRRSLAGETMGKVRMTVSNNQEGFFDQARRSIELVFFFLQQPGEAQSALSMCSSFFFLKLALRRRSRSPSPETNALHFASFCELLRRPLNNRVCDTPVQIVQDNSCKKMCQRPCHTLSPVDVSLSSFWETSPALLRSFKLSTHRSDQRNILLVPSYWTTRTTDSR